MRRLFRQFSLPRRHPEPRRAGDAGLDPRGRRARLRAVARLRRRLRQPGPAGLPAWSATARRRPGRWRPAGTPTSSSTRRRTARCCRSCTSTATRSPTRRCSRASRTRSSRRCSRATATSRHFVEGDDPPTVHQQMAAHARRGGRRDRRDPAGRPRGRRARHAAALADDRAAHAEGLDRSEGGRRQAGRGDLALAPGADGRGPHERGAPCRCSSRGCALPARGAVRRPTAACVPELAALAPTGHRRMSANPIANGGRAAARPAAAGLPGLRASTSRSRATTPARRPACSAPTCATSCAANTDNFRVFGPGRDGVEPAWVPSSR